MNAEAMVAERDVRRLDMLARRIFAAPTDRHVAHTLQNYETVLRRIFARFAPPRASRRPTGPVAPTAAEMARMAAAVGWVSEPPFTVPDGQLITAMYDIQTALQEWS